MTPVRARFALAALTALVVAVAFNAMFLQQEIAKDAMRQQADAGRESNPTRTAQVEISPSDTDQHASAAKTARGNARWQIGVAPPQPSVAIRLDKSDADHTVVSGIQRELSNLGYEPGPVDGIAGIKTRAAIMAFEHDERMALSAEPSDMLLKRLVFGAPGRTQKAAPIAPVSEQARQIIVGVQESLIRLGYGLNKSSGRLDEATQQAIRAFERENELAPSGRVSGRLILRLTRTKSSRLDLAAKWR